MRSDIGNQPGTMCREKRSEQPCVLKGRWKRFYLRHFHRPSRDEFPWELNQGRCPWLISIVASRLPDCSKRVLPTINVEEPKTQTQILPGLVLVLRPRISITRTRMTTRTQNIRVNPCESAVIGFFARFQPRNLGSILAGRRRAKKDYTNPPVEVSIP